MCIVKLLSAINYVYQQHVRADTCCYGATDVPRMRRNSHPAP